MSYARSIGDLLLNWYQRQLGSKVELSRPGEDEYSVYLHIEGFKGEKEVLAFFMIPESVEDFVEEVKRRIKLIDEKEVPVDFIDVWVPEEWIGRLEEVVDSYFGGENFPIIRIRDSSQLNIPLQAFQELVPASPRKLEPVKRDFRLEEERRALRRERRTYITNLTEERLEEVLERVIRKVEEERRIREVEKSVGELQRRISLLEEVIRFLISSRTSPPAESPLALRGIEKRELREREEGAQRVESRPKIMREPDRIPRKRSNELIEEFIKDNPWAEVLRRRGSKSEER